MKVIFLDEEKKKYLRTYYQNNKDRWKKYAKAPKTEEEKKADNLMSVDRINSKLGYIKGNVQVISNKANRMKNDASIEELLIFSKNAIKMHEGNLP